MRIGYFYQAFLRLYPSDFRKRFFAEMLGVFEQQANERFVHGGVASIAFIVTEFSGIAKGAFIMWMAKIFPTHRNPSQSSTAAPAGARLTIADVNAQRDAAIENMVASIAEHNFIEARQYSYEEVRLKNLLQELRNEVPAGDSKTV